jgi:hypothetical protein
MALTSSGSTPAQQATVIVHYLFGSIPIAAIIILMSQFALNDINLYESINAMTNVFNMKRYYSIAMLFGVVVSIVLSIPGNVIPNFGLSIGVAPLEGWVAAVILYLVMIAVVRGKADLRWTIGQRTMAAE